MTVDSIRVVLGRLQDDPGSEQAWQELAEIVTAPASASNVEVHRLLEQARSRHEQRREWVSVARMLEMEVVLVAGQPEELAMQAELARIADEELFDAARARQLYERLGELARERGSAHPLAEKASTWLEDDAAKREKWESLYDRYLAESESTDDVGFQAGLLVGAADVAFRYAGDKVDATVVADLVERAVSLDPRARRGLALAERSLAADPARLTKLFTTVLDRGASKEDRVAAGIKAARLCKQLGESERATEAYEKVLDLAPGQPDALSELAEAYTRAEAWDHLVALYEDQLKSGGRPDGELGLLLQIAMVHWKMRGKPEAAEPYFERVRRSEPMHAGMLAFYRERCSSQEDKPKLLAVLTEAQRATNDGELKRELAAEIAQLAEAQDNAVKAIEQYKAILKADPDDLGARDALKRLYAQTNNHPALIDLYRHELERIGADDVAARAAVLRELATIHRDRHRNEQALIQTLAQLVQLDDKDEAVLRELVQLYESLGRFRDLLGAQQRLAELTSDPSERAELYRAVARRWTEQFSNVQNAIAAYEGLLAVDKTDTEARAKLRDLYTKRRAWDRLHALASLELETAEGEARVELLTEMAKLAAERLDRGAEAIALYQQILELDPRNFAIHDALEKQAEREKDYAAVAASLEKRAEVTDDGAAKLAIYQKLGAIYADRLRDDVGATRTWKRVLELSPGQAKALRVLRETYVSAGDLDSLEELYASQGDWDALADFLSTSADKATEPDSKIALSFRAAKVYVERLKAPERATRSFERVLASDPGNAEAASALLPIYEQEERWARLPALYEILLTVTESPAERAGMLRKLADVAGHSLGDRAAALNHARRAYELAPDAEGLELLESWARAAGDFAPFVEAVSARLGTGGGSASVSAPKKGKKKKKSETAAADVDADAPQSLRGAPSIDPAEERLLRIKLADAYARELGKLDEAVDEYKKLLVADPKDDETARALDTLLRGAERQSDLRWLFELRIANASDAERAGIYEEWATLEEDVFGNTTEAVRLYREAVALEHGRTETLRPLARLLLAAGDHAGAAGVIERHRDLVHGDERAQREIELATLYAEHLGRPLDALEACERALDARPRDADAIGLLGKLVELEPTRGRAAARLALSYADLGDHRREAQMLRALIETTEDADRRLELHVSLADAEEKKLGSPSAAFDVVLRALNEFPDELGLWDRASELAVSAGRPTDLAEAYRAHILVSRDGDDAERHGPSVGVELELCDRAASLHDEQLGDSDGALPYLKRILSKDPRNATAFARLKEILSAAERWGELESLFDQAAALADDPRTKIELLSEVALIAEEVMGLPEKAIRYHERILEIDPLHEASLDALEKLYEDAERFGELAALLERRLETALDDEAVDIRLYLARLYLDQLLVPERALVHVEEILRSRSDDADARELAERMLEIGSLKRRVASLLEGVYEARDEVKDLVRMLEIHLEYVDDENVEERATILRRIAELRDERLKDDEGAFEALGLLVPLLPEDEALRERFSEVGRRLDKHGDVVDVLSRAADSAQPKLVRAEILMSVATLAEDALGDSAKAAEIYRKVLAIDPDDTAIGAPATRALARIQSASGDFAQLAGTLETQAKLEESVDARKELYARLGELYETTLDQPEKAIAAWQSRLADDDGDLASLSALERLYERAGKHRELVDVLRRRESAEDDADTRRRVMVKAAQTLADRLDEPQEAISAWRAVTDDFGADREAHAALRRLYEKTERFQDLADIIEADLALADDPAERRKLLVASGDVRRKHLGELEAALEAYRSALELDPNDAEARSALEAMLDLDDAKRGACEILRPLYEVDGAFEALLRVLGLEAELEEVPAERIAILEKARETAEGPLADQQKAYEYAQRVVRDAVSDDSLGRQVETLERLSKETNRWSDTCTLYRSVVDEVADGELQLAMLLRIGALAREEVRDLPLAVEYYQKALEASPDELRALTALEQIYAEKGDDQALLGVLGRRAELADTDAERVELLFRSAELQQEKLGDTAAAVATLESLLDYQVDERATSKLELLYRKAERHRDLVALYERMLEASGADPAELRVKIARLARGPLEDMPRAFDELSEALALESAHPGAVAELESVLDSQESSSEDRARAAEMLEPVYLKQAAWKKVERATQARLEASHDPDERAELLRRLATLYEEQLEDYGAALETTAKLLSENIGDEAVWAELERLARVGSSHARLAEIFATELSKVEHDDESTARLSARTGEIYAAEGKLTEALRWYRRAHAFEPESEVLFGAIDGLLVKEERHAERVDLLKAALDYRNGAPRLELLHTIAELEETKLERADDAIESYRAALDVDPHDELALDRLGRLYEKLERHRDLAELYERRADQADLSEQAAPYRLALARLLISKLDDIQGAIDQLEAIVGADPKHRGAIAELEKLTELEEYRSRIIEILRPLYEDADAWQKVVELNEQRLAGRSKTHRERAAILRETAVLWETRGSDARRRPSTPCARPSRPTQATRRRVRSSSGSRTRPAPSSR
jgi:golgin subfamily B member 1